MTLPAPEPSMMDHALACIERGLRVFPVKENAKFPPLVQAPYDAATTDILQVLEWWTNWPNANIGVDTSSGYVVIDVDVKPTKDGRPMAELLGIDPDKTFSVSTPSGGFHAYYATDDVFSGGTDVLGPGLDVRAHHNYVLGPGSVIGGRRYSARNSQPHQSLGLDLRPAARRAVGSGHPPVVDLDGDGAISRATDYARRAEPAIEGHGGDQRTYVVAAVIRDFGVSESTCLNLLSEHWNPRCAPPWGEDELAVKVENAYRYAQNPAGVEATEYVFRDVKIEAPAPPPKPKSKWHAHGDEWRGAVTWLYKGLLPTTGVCLLNGPSQSGKTFVALELADSLRSGRPFFGHAPRMKGATIILSAEGFGSMKHRMAALGENGERLPIATRYVGNLCAPGEWTELTQDIQAKAEEMAEEYGMPVRMIILDTLSASGAMEDENDNSEAGRVMRAFGELSEALGCLFVAIHHPPKSGKGERGAGAIRNNADYVLEVVREGTDPVRQLSVTKSRDGEQKDLGAFTLRPVVLGKDEDGDDEITMRVSTGEDAPVAAHREPAYTDKFLEVLDNVLSAPRGEIIRDAGVLEADLVDAFREAKDGSKDRSNVAKAFRAAKQWLAAKMTIEQVVLEGQPFIRRKVLRI